eukprot:6157421-Alexandrium_andersonii.AAC.1
MRAHTQSFLAQKKRFQEARLPSCETLLGMYRNDFQTETQLPWTRFGNCVCRCLLFANVETTSRPACCPEAMCANACALPR